MLRVVELTHRRHLPPGELAGGEFDEDVPTGERLEAGHDAGAVEGEHVELVAVALLESVDDGEVIGLAVADTAGRSIPFPCMIAKRSWSA